VEINIVHLREPRLVGDIFKHREICEIRAHQSDRQVGGGDRGADFPHGLG
jgi:hypothetical protein